MGDVNGFVQLIEFSFSDVDNPRSISYCVYISQLIRFARVSSHVTDFSMHVIKF